MKAEKPAEGILKRNDFGDSKYYQIVCSCGQEYHDHQMEVEADECGVNVNIYATFKTDYWTETVEPSYDIENEALQETNWFFVNLFNNTIRKISLTWELWTTGAITTETTIHMTKQQALNYATTLKSAIKDVEQFEAIRKRNGELQNRVAKRLAEEADRIRNEQNTRDT